MSSEEQEYEFEYESDADESDGDVDIENEYYNAKGKKDDDKEEALTGFIAVIGMQEDKDEWGFKALKQMVKILFEMGRFDDMMVRYKEMLTYIKSAVTRNMSEKKINGILDFVSGSDNADLLQQFYKTTLQALQDASNERLWFKTNLKLGTLCFTKGDYGRLKQILKELHKSCMGANGEDDVKKGTQLQEIYALEIQMYTEMKDNVNLKRLYERALRIKSAIPHPRIIGLIRECGGKMHMAEHKWDHAYTDFFEAFKSYDEAGNKRRVSCLKYLVLANMLAKKDMDPFNAQETKPYKNDPEIMAMTKLVAAFNSDNIAEFEMILRDNRQTVMEDSFIRNYIEDLLKTIRTQVLVKLIKPYTRIGIEFIGAQLNIPADDVEPLCVALILDGVLKGKIDQIDRVIHLDKPVASAGGRPTGTKFDAMEAWSSQLKHMTANLSSKLAAATI